MKALIAAAIGIAGLLLAWGIDHRSLERANRLYRAEAFEEAARMYEARLAGDPASVQLHYNFGTALLGLRSEKAREELTRASSEHDDDIKRRALYNLGLWNLIEALVSEGSDAARVHALRAVAIYKSVLRLNPGDPDASWNLAICLRLLASIDSDTAQAGPAAAKGTAPRDGAPDEQDVTRNEDQEQGPRAAEGETAAKRAEGAPLTLKEAADILGTGHRDPTMMVRKLMAAEGRAERLRASGRTPQEKH